MKLFHELRRFYLLPFTKELEGSEGSGSGDSGAGGSGAGNSGGQQGGSGEGGGSQSQGAQGGGTQTQTVSNTPGPIISADGKFTADFAKAYPSLAKFTSLDAALKSHVNLERMLGAQGKVAPITATSSPEEIAAWRKAAGVPDKPEGYEITRPKEINGKPIPDALWNDDKTKAYISKMHEAGMSKAQVETMIKFGLEQGIDTLGTVTEQVAKTRSEGEAALKKEWGSDYTKNLAEAERGAALLGLTKDMVAADPMLANNVNFTRMALKAASMSKETTSPGTRGGNNQAPADVTGRIRELQTMMSNPAYRRSPAFAQHEQNMAEMKELVAQKEAMRNQG